MTVYFLTIGNIHNEETETVQGACWDECYRLAADVADEMLENIKKTYENDDTFNQDAFSIDDDITFTEDEQDAYEYSLDY